MNWLSQLQRSEKQTLVACFAGYAVDSFDYMIYSFMIPTLVLVWHMSKSEAGLIATASLLSSALGGWLAGILADKYGRVRMLQFTIGWFCIFTFLSGLTHSPGQLLVTRTLQGLGMGGEWSVGSVLIAEIIRPEHRGKAVGVVQSSWAVGWGLAAIMYAVVYSFLPEVVAWRVLFLLGVVPAALIVVVRRHVKESSVYLETKRKSDSGKLDANFLRIFSPSMLKTTILASLVATGLQGGYYGVTTWLPTYLKTVRHLSVFNTSGYLVVLITGSFLGYLAGAYCCDRLGRRKTFVIFAVASTVLVTTYMLIPITNTQMLLLGLPLGMSVSGVFSGMGAFLSELFPNEIRGSGQGFCYNFGRAIGAVFPALIGFLSTRMGLGRAIGIFAGAAYGVLVIAALSLPETKGKGFHEEAQVDQAALVK
jgi:MFS family permease